MEIFTRLKTNELWKNEICICLDGSGDYVVAIFVDSCRNLSSGEYQSNISRRCDYVVDGQIRWFINWFCQTVDFLTDGLVNLFKS